MEKRKQGTLISIEGIDGSGKSTLAKNLKKKLETNSFDVLLTYEPGDTDLGKHIRKILQERNFDMCGVSEFLLFAADRAQHFKDVIAPHLQKNKIIISDRMADSSLVYQGYGRGVNIQKIEIINKWAMNGITPDITVYIKISLDTALERLRKRKSIPTTFEKEKEEFTKKLINGYQKIYQNKKNIITLDGEKSANSMADEAYLKIEKFIIGKGD